MQRDGQVVPVNFLGASFTGRHFMVLDFQVAHFQVAHFQVAQGARIAVTLAADAMDENLYRRLRVIFRLGALPTADQPNSGGVMTVSTGAGRRLG